MLREIEQGPDYQFVNLQPDPPPGGLAQSARQHRNAELEISNRPGHGDLGSSRDTSFAQR